MALGISAAPSGRPRVLARLASDLRSTPALLFGFFLGVYALTSAGRFDAADGIVIADTAHALLVHHTLALPPGNISSVIGVGGWGYTKYGIALSLVEMPFVAVGLLVQHATHDGHMLEWVVSFTNTVVTALVCAVFYALVRRLGAGVRRGVALTLVYGLCTLAWPYAKTDFTEPLQTLSLVLAAYAAVRARQSRNARWLWLCGAALALAMLTKVVLALAVPAFVLYVLSDGILDGERRGIRETFRDARWWRVTISREVVLLVPVLVGLAVTFWLNAARFGSPLDFGYGRSTGDADFGTPIWIGLFGLLFSLNSGLIVYATPVLLGLPGIRRFVRRQPAEALLAGVLVGAILVLYGTYRYWAGMAAFGPRYIVPLIPFILLPAIDAFPGLWSRRRAQRWVLAVVCAVAVLGFAEQTLGVLVSIENYSAFTCVTSPCTDSLDASRSELLYDIWLLPSSLAYNFLGQPPHVTPAGYPFSRTPAHRSGWNIMVLDQMRYLWFVWLPAPKLALAVGLALFGSLIGVCAAGLVKVTRLFEASEDGEGDKAASAAAELATTGGPA